jgi:hypothetical protein
MDLNRLAIRLLYGAGFGVFCGVVGMLLGGLARAFAHYRRRIAEPTFTGALLSGALLGALFNAMLGAVLGASAAYFQMLDLAIGAVALLPFVACLALIFGLLAYFLEWLGTSGKADLPPDHDALLTDLPPLQDPAKSSDAFYEPPTSIR